MPKRNWNVNGLSLSELLNLRAAVEAALRDRIDNEQSELRARLEELSSMQNGSDRRTPRVNDKAPKARRALAKAHPLKGRKVSPKYRGPDGQTWSGRGLPPRWLSELERKGKKRESFLINSAN